MERAEYIVLFIFVATGIIALTSAVFDFDWYFQSRRAAVFVSWLGRNGARLFYGLLGLTLIAAGVLFFLYGYRS
ncbi:MAG: immunity 17 family protein [Tannerellaceae bacterium]|jgi:small neutral amino acid transporter SnatA (MarC family)|nr:immunity 17 family protein [Tannerellaceae bacterium]